MDTRHRFTLTYLVIAMLALFGVQSFLQNRDVVELRYSEFRSLVEKKKVKEVVVFSDDIKGACSSSHRRARRAL
jgi:hypothetical protein